MEIKGFFIDLDGVLTKDEKFSPINGSVEFINLLKEKSIPFVIATSNSRFPPEEIAKRMKENGFNVEKEDIVSPLVVAPQILKEEGVKTLYVLGSDMLADYLKNCGFYVENRPDVDSVLVGLDKNLNFQKLKIATTALKVNRAKLYALNKNIISKDDDGMLFPGVGTVAKMLSIACQCNENFKHFGKMSEDYNKIAFRKLNAGSPEKVMMISDDIYVDLKGYKQLGLKTVFVSTGKYTKAEAEDKKFIDLILDRIFDLVGRLKLL